jgi:hypothetical protein
LRITLATAAVIADKAALKAHTTSAAESFGDWTIDGGGGFGSTKAAQTRIFGSLVCCCSEK